jgi:hypothetical protein
MLPVESVDLASGIEGDFAHDKGLLIRKLRDNVAVIVGNL